MIWVRGNKRIKGVGIRGIGESMYVAENRSAPVFKVVHAK